MKKSSKEVVSGYPLWMQQYRLSTHSPNKLGIQGILECPDCSEYTPDGSWGEKCLDEVDIEAHEESRRERLFEEHED